MKTQHVRLLDIFVFGPFMLWSAYQLKNESARIAMLSLGVGTIVYNWENYKEQNEKAPRT